MHMKPKGPALALLASLLVATGAGASSFHAGDEFVIAPAGEWPAVAFNGQAFTVGWFEPAPPGANGGGALHFGYVLPNDTRFFDPLALTLPASERFNGPLALSTNGYVTSFFWTERNTSITDREVNQLLGVQAFYPPSFGVPRVLAAEVGSDAVKRYGDEAYSGFAVASSDTTTVVTYARQGAIYCRTSADSFAAELVVAPASEVATSSLTQLRPSVEFSGSHFLITWFEPAGDPFWLLRGARIGTDGKLLDPRPQTVATYDVPAGASPLSPPVGPYHHSVTSGGVAPLVQFQADGMTSSDPYDGLEEHREFVESLTATALDPHAPAGLLRYQGFMPFRYAPDEACRTVFDGTAYISVCPDYYFTPQSVVACPAADDRLNDWSYRVQRRDGGGSPTDAALAFAAAGIHHGFGLARGDGGTSLLVYATDRGIVGRFLNEKPVPHRRAAR